MATAARSPEVKLGQTVSHGIAPSLFALLDRGVMRRPDLAGAIQGKLLIRFREDISPVRVEFGPRVIRVEDGELRDPDVVISGSLPHVVQLTMTPMRMGIPDVRDARGRAALARVASGRVRLRGDVQLARRVLEMMAVPAPEGPHRRVRRKRSEARSPDGEAAWIDVLT